MKVGGMEDGGREQERSFGSNIGGMREVGCIGGRIGGSNRRTDRNRKVKRRKRRSKRIGRAGGGG